MVCRIWERTGLSKREPRPADLLVADASPLTGPSRCFSVAVDFPERFVKQQWQAGVHSWMTTTSFTSVVCLLVIISSVLSYENDWMCMDVMRMYDVVCVARNFEECLKVTLFVSHHHGWLVCSLKKPQEHHHHHQSHHSITSLTHSLLLFLSTHHHQSSLLVCVHLRGKLIWKGYPRFNPKHFYDHFTVAKPFATHTCCWLQRSMLTLNHSSLPKTTSHSDLRPRTDAALQHNNQSHTQFWRNPKRHLSCPI